MTGLPVPRSLAQLRPVKRKAQRAVNARLGMQFTLEPRALQLRDERSALRIFSGRLLISFRNGCTCLSIPGEGRWERSP